MKNILIIHFLIALVILFISGTGIFLPALITFALVALQRVAIKLDLAPANLPSWIKILGICYSANLLLFLLQMIL